MLVADSPRKVESHSDVNGVTARYSGLDGLRALAVTAVVLFHADFAWARGGYLGVDLFFVISGFLITSLVVREVEATGRLALRAFYWRRAKRLLPASLFMTAAVVVAATWLAPDALPHLRRDVVASLVYMTNWGLLSSDISYFEAMGQPPLMQHLWSLAIEEQFYLVWAPLCLFVLPRFGRRRMISIAIVMATASAGAMGALAIIMDYPAQGDPSRLYFGTDTHGFALILGGAFGLHWRPQQRTVPAGFAAHGVTWLSGLSALALLVFMFARMGENHPFLYPWGFLAAALAGIVLIAAAIHPGVAFGRFLDNSPMRWIGVRSYGIYLWHWPVFVLTRPDFDLSDVGNALAFVLRMCLTFALAEVSYRNLEMPVRQGFLDRLFTTARGRSWPARVSVVSTVSAAAFAIGIILWEAPVEALPARDVRDALELDIPPLRGPSAVKPATAVAAPQVPITAVAALKATAMETPAAAATEVTDDPIYTGAQLTVVGDSVMLGSSRLLKARLPGTDLHATMGWQAADVLRQLQSLKKAHALRPVVVVHRGTNGYITEPQLRQILGLLATCDRVVLVNTRVPRRWMASNNELIDDVAPDFPNVLVVRWSDTSDKKPDYFISDRVHLTAKGQKALIADVMRAGRLKHEPSMSTKSDAYWRAIAQCHTNSNWHDEERQLGGLDIGLGAWSAWGGESFAPTPSEATPEQQMVVANRISTQGWINATGEHVKPIGFDHWKCDSTAGAPGSAH
jgi:peptidoglycan/LPS O-acetylase OafA/YrhL